MAADTSTEVARKIKEKFLKDASKVIVKNLSVYRKSEAAPNNPIKTVEDFKHLAKKVTISVCISVSLLNILYPFIADQLYNAERAKALHQNRGSQSERAGQEENRRIREKVHDQIHRRLQTIPSATCSIE